MNQSGCCLPPSSVLLSSAFLAFFDADNNVDNYPLEQLLFTKSAKQEHASDKKTSVKKKLVA